MKDMLSAYHVGVFECVCMCVRARVHAHVFTYVTKIITRIYDCHKNINYLERFKIKTIAFCVRTNRRFVLLQKILP